MRHLILAVLMLMGSAVAADRPNVLVILVDDLRNSLHCYGAEQIHSPVIDSLAKDGVLFEHAYSQYALCGPSRASFFTACYPKTTGVFRNGTNIRDTRPDAVTLPGHFKANGYSTQGIGKILHDTQRDPQSWTLPRLFEEGHHYAGEGLQDKIVGIDGLHDSNRVLPITECVDVPDNAYRDGIATGDAVAALRKAAKTDRPFCLMVGYHKPHTPFCAPKRYWDLYDRDSLKLAAYQQMPEGTPQTVAYHGRYLRHFAGVPDEGEIPEDIQRKLLHGYFACVSYIDAQVGVLLGELKTLGLDENTIIVLTSDHGYQLGEHGLWCKHSNFEDATRVPLIIRDPRQQQQGRVVSDMVELVSIAPTLWELCGLPKVGNVDGASIAPLLAGEKPRRRVARSRYHGKAGQGVSIRVKNYRYTRWTNKKGKTNVEELYDYAKDPDERRNQVKNPEYAPQLKKLRQLWQKESATD